MMSMPLVREEVSAFLESPRPEVLCLKGRWGVGKTYAWNSILAEAKSGNGIALDTYSYVSLFGLNSIDDLKYAIFEHSIDKSNIGIEPSVSTLRSNTIGVAQQFGKKAFSFLQQLPGGKDYSSAVQSLAFLSVHKKIVCIDDLERKGSSLELRDVLGLVSLLRDQKQCKVVLILNDDQLDDSAKSEFVRYHEKVIDLAIEFAPTPAECVEIALPKSAHAPDSLRDTIVALGLSNIRIIKKIERLAKRAERLTAGRSPNVQHQMLQTLAVLAWSLYGKDENAPPIEFLRKKRGRYTSSPTGEDSVEESNWHSKLDRLGFVMMDELDLLLLEGMEKGFFDERTISSHIEKLEAKERANQSASAFHSAWDLYHDCFDDNEDDVVAAITSALRENVEFVTLTSLEGAVRLLKELARDEEAKDLIHFYIRARQEPREFFDLSKAAFGDMISDVDVREAFRERHRTFRDDRLPRDVLLQIDKNSGFSQDDVAFLSALSWNDFYKLFLNERSSDLTRIVRASLLFGKVVNGSPEMKAIADNAKEALTALGKTSPINRLRVRKFGVQLDA